MKNTVRELVERELQQAGFVSDSTKELACELKRLADEAWEKSSEWAARGNCDPESEYQRGRAHAFCEVLGDQEALSLHGVFDGG